jgi:pSer/pThr/pTyr-binding forkhead associated (FHA) protein
VIACEVCGTDNDPKLTFCRTCGHRLRPKQPRPVPPTPATGLAKAKLPSDPPEADDGWELDEKPGARHSRPSAPPLQFGRGRAEPAQPTAAEAARRPDPVGAAAVEDPGSDKIRCNECGASSPKGYRFCISCGAALKSTREPGKQTKPLGDEMAAMQPAQRTKALEPRVVSPKPGAAEAVAVVQDLVTCDRCGNQCSANEAFCKYCGAPLGKAAKPSSRGAAPPRPKTKDGEQKIDGGDPFPLAGKPSEGRRAPPARPAVGKESGARTRPEPPRGAEDEEVTGRLVVIVEDGSEGRTIELRGRQMDIGSSDGDIILPEDRYLSPRHARFFRQDAQWYLRNLDSVNGVFRRLRKQTQLRDRDLVLLGLEVLQFQLVDHAERGLGHAIQHGVLVFGSPAATRRARLLQRTVEGVVRDVYHLVSDETTIGRETGDIVFTSDPFMSRRHAAIQWDEEGEHYILVDLNSSNGTYLAIRDDVRLDNGDFIRLGQHLFRVDLPDKTR